MVFRVGHPPAEGAAGPGGGSAGAFAPATTVARLQQSLNGRLSPAQSRTLASLAGEADAELFAQGLLDLARRVQHS
ncbi:MAG TPA: hypothetical protein VJR29_04995, partial [bacterium]|nr:hypothetical protein [bacterium]